MFASHETNPTASCSGRYVHHSLYAVYFSLAGTRTSRGIYSASVVQSGKLGSRLGFLIFGTGVVRRAIRGGDIIDRRAKSLEAKKFRGGWRKAVIYKSGSRERKSDALRGFCGEASWSGIRVARNSQKQRERSPLESRRVYGNERSVRRRWTRSGRSEPRTTSLNSAAWRASERASEREKRDGETARILFAIKARDNLKAITITHGLGVYAVRCPTAASPALRRDRGHALSSPLGSFCDFHAANRPPFPRRACQTENKPLPVPPRSLHIFPLPS